jgi:hypothetical protein
MHPEYFENLKREIEKGLYEVQSYINFKKSTNKEISFISELFIEDLLNEIYRDEGYHFINLNYKYPNSPAIDLADEKHEISYQITVTNDSGSTNKKVEETLQSFYKRGLQNQYKKLYIVIASGIKDKSRLTQKKTVTIDGKPNPIDPQLFDKKNILDLTDIAKEIIFKKTANFERIREVINKIPNRPEKKTFPFTLNHSYIERSVYDSNNNQKTNLAEVVNSNKRNVLLGVGGLGKTTEINFLANKISSSDNFYCFKVRLIKYANTLDDLLKAYCPNWQNVPMGFKTLFILDGLDEVGSLKIDTASKEIKQFSVLHSEINILVTCRTNFNPFNKEEDESTENNNFNELFLNEINDNDIKTFIFKECSSPEIFLQAVKKSNIGEIFKNPFYLVNAVEIFNSQNIIPESKSDFFRKLIDQRIEGEKKKSNSFRDNVNEYFLIEGLKLLALTMQFSGLYQISNYDFNRIIKKQETRDAIKRIFFYREENNWQFEHNNFQEFLAADAILRLGWGKIKKLILLPNKKLKPKWLNAFSFLVNLIPNNNELISWFVEHDIDSLVKVEPDKMERDIRNQVFIQILDNHSTNETIIWGLSYSTQDLYRFGQLEKNEKLIKFLLIELQKSESTIQSISNAVHLLAELDNPGTFKERIRQIFFELLKDKGNHKFGITYTILNSFSKWKMFDVETKDILTCNENLFDKEAPLSSLCHYLIDGKFTDITAELVYKLILSFEDHRVIGAEYVLYNVVKLISHNEIILLIQKLTPTDFNGRPRIWLSDLFKIINSYAIETYHKDSKIEKVITEYVYASFVYHDQEYAKAFKSFFEKTNLVFTSFKINFIRDLKSEKSNRREFFTLPSLIANTECLDWVVKFYMDNPFSDNMMWNFLISLNIVGNYDGRSYFMQKIKGLTEGRFEPKPSPWDIFNKDKDELYLKSLLDQELALSFIEKGFKVFGKDEVTREEVIKKQFDQEDRYVDVELTVGLEIISQNSDKKINKDEFIKRFSNKDSWDWFVVDEYYHLIPHKKLPVENLKWIENWCKENLPNVKIKGAITETKAGSYSFLNLTNYFLQFAMLIDYPLSEFQYLELTNLIGLGDFNININNTTTEYRLSDYIKKNTDLTKFRIQILKNLEEGQLVSWVLDAHVKIIETEGWLEGIRLFPRHIIKSDIPKYVRSRMLRLYKLNKGNPDELVPVLETLAFLGDENYFDWEVIDYLVEERNYITIEFLNNHIDDKTIDQLKLGVYLIKADQKIAFDIVTKNLKKLSGFSENDFLTTTISQIPNNVFDSNILSNFLIEILNIYIDKDWGSSGFNNLLPILFNKIFQIVTDTALNEKFVLKSIKDILNSSKKNETNRRVRYELYSLEDKINIHMDKGCQISDAISELKELGIEYSF